LIFSTKDREPFLDEAIKESMHAYLATMARDRGWECYRDLLKKTGMDFDKKYVWD
jgi:hypothetical protein